MYIKMLILFFLPLPKAKVLKDNVNCLSGDGMRAVILLSIILFALPVLMAYKGSDASMAKNVPVWQETKPGPITLLSVQILVDDAEPILHPTFAQEVNSQLKLFHGPAFITDLPVYTVKEKYLVKGRDGSLFLVKHPKDVVQLAIKRGCEVESIRLTNISIAVNLVSDSASLINLPPDFPVFIVRTKEKFNLFNIVPLQVDREYVIAADTGEVLTIEQPWFSVLGSFESTFLFS